MPLLLAPLLFIGVILLEIWLFVVVGGAIGGGWTVLWVLASAVLGLASVRPLGYSVLFRLHKRMAENDVPSGELFDMVMLAMGAGLLVLPGFFTDAVGVFLLLPPGRWALRRLAGGWLQRAARRGQVGGYTFVYTTNRPPGGGAQPRRGPKLVNPGGESHEEPPGDDPTRR